MSRRDDKEPDQGGNLTDLFTKVNPGKVYTTYSLHRDLAFAYQDALLDYYDVKRMIKKGWVPRDAKETIDMLKRRKKEIRRCEKMIETLSINDRECTHASMMGDFKIDYVV